MYNLLRVSPLNVDRLIIVFTYLRWYYRYNIALLYI